VNCAEKSSQEEDVDAKRLADRGSFSAEVAHELRNPLTVINIAITNIKRKSSGAGLDHHIDTIEKKIAEIDMILNNLLCRFVKKQ
jgi:signal transduction histidine kinase